MLLPLAPPVTTRYKSPVKDLVTDVRILRCCVYQNYFIANLQNISIYRNKVTYLLSREMQLNSLPLVYRYLYETLVYIAAKRASGLIVLLGKQFLKPLMTHIVI